MDKTERMQKKALLTAEIGSKRGEIGFLRLKGNDPEAKQKIAKLESEIKELLKQIDAISEQP